MNMTKAMMLFTAVVLFMGQLLAQSNRTVTGKVTDDKGVPLAGVSVKVKGTNIGTTTDGTGSFQLSIPSTAKTLQVSSLNFEITEIAVTSSATYSISLNSSSKSLDDVVVTALGIAKDKRSLGYATQTIKATELADRGELNVVSALQGKVAGVDITGASGAAGSSVNINIRGISSFNGDNQPLFVIDGIPISNNVDRTGNTLFDQQPPNRALDLNLNEIESINVLKGPAASALYGQRGASGAIIITTKRGAAGKGKVNVSYTSSYSQQYVYGLPEFQNEYGQGAGGLFNATSAFSYGPKFGSTPTLSNGLLTATGATVDYTAYPDNIRNFFETGSIFENNINISSGDKKQNYSLTMGNVRQVGMLPNTSLNRTNIGINFNSQLSEKFSIGASAQYSGSRQIGILQGNGAQSAMFQLFSVPRSFNLEFYKDNYKNPDGTNNWPINTTRDNPYFAAYEDPLTSKLNRFLGNVKVGYDVLDWLNVSYRLGVDGYTDRRKRVVAVNSNAYPLGRVLEDNFFRSEINGDLIVTAKKQNLFKKDIDATLLVGQNFNARNYQNLYVQSDNLGIPGFYNVSNGGSFASSGETTRLQRLVGFYSQLSLAYKNYLFLELTGRMDKSSTLAEGNNTFFYPSVAASFVFTDVLRVKSDVLSYGKIRANVAKVGKDAAPYLLDNVYVTRTYGNNVAQFNFPYGGTLGFTASNRIGNNNLTPEFTTSYEFGLNLGLFRNMISVDAAYFYQSSQKQIVNVGIPVSTGYASYSTNTGEIVNKGIELVVSAAPITRRNFKWEINANYTRLRNLVTSIGFGVKSFGITGNAFSGQTPSIVEGQPYGVIVGNAWQRSPDGQLLINPATGTPLGTTSGQVIADPNRDWTAGLGNTFKYKKLSLYFLLDFKQGGDFISWTATTFRSLGALKETGVDRESPMIFPGVIKQADGKFVPNNIQIPAQTYWNSMGSGTGAGDFGVFDATTFRVREVSLAYDLPGSTFKTRLFSSARFSIFGRNLFYYAPNSPVDPEVNTQGAGNIRGMELQSAPNSRTIGASVRITFN
jgi:TonB-linked SusC/RagA family outer membrane protein